MKKKISDYFFNNLGNSNSIALKNRASNKNCLPHNASLPLLFISPNTLINQIIVIKLPIIPIVQPKSVISLLTLFAIFF